MDQFRDAYDHRSSYPHDVCSYCQSFDHDVNSCLYYDGFDEAHGTLNTMIETMNERHMQLVNEMREFGLSHEIDPNLPFAGLEASLYNDGESSHPLESNVVDNAPLTDLEGVFDSPLTSFPFVAPSFSSTRMDTSVSDLTLLASPFPLAQCMGLEKSEIFRGVMLVF